jgi:putative peptide zinc metalloprotease protein
MRSNFKLHNNQGKYLLIINEIHYSINEITYFILENIKKEISFNEIAFNVESKFKIHASESDIKDIVESQIDPLFNKQHKIKNNTSFWLKREILQFDQYKSIINKFGFLFHHKIFWYFFFPLLGLNIYLLFNLSTPNGNILDCRQSILLSFLSYVSLFVIIMIHEFAHASAALNFNVKAKCIGFGFYSIFPVFFADITGIWTLNKNKRMIVNLAGIFIQCILGIIIFIIYRYFIQNSTNYLLHHFLFYLFVSNAITLLVNLYPFFKFDGYWCYSDLFNSPNLTKNSKTLVFSLLYKIIPLPFLVNKKEIEKVNLHTIPLQVYTFCKGITNIFLIVFLGNMILKSIKQICNINSYLIQDVSWCSLKTSFIYLFFIWIIGRLFYNNLKKIYSVLIKIVK